MKVITSNLLPPNTAYIINPAYIDMWPADEQEPTLVVQQPEPFELPERPIPCPECGFNHTTWWTETVTLQPPDDWEYPKAWWPEVPQASLHALCTQCGWKREAIR